MPSPVRSSSVALSVLALTLGATPIFADTPPPTPTKPDVLFLIVDDLNTWLGYTGTHPLVKTPHIDRLATRGTAFLNAHCQAPLCNPSRTSLFTGLRPSTTGIYGLAPGIRKLPEYDNHPTLSQWLRRHDYDSRTINKVWHGFHQWTPEQRAAEFDVIGKLVKDPRPSVKLVGETPGGNHAGMDWGVFPHRDEDKVDYQTATWTAAQMADRDPQRPLALFVGLFLPHVPTYVTQPWMDLYPDDDTVLPPVLADDRADTPRFSWYLHWSLPEPRLTWMQMRNEWRHFVRTYLASISFMDAQVGRILDALDASGRADRTLIVLVGDNGYHLGEKAITGKNSLWDPSTRVPLLLAGPGVPAGVRVTEPVELLDLYPTLVDLAGLPQPAGLEGVSLRPQLSTTRAPRERPAITSQGPGNDSVRTARWRYIRYADGAEELYDMQADPYEWHNLAGRPEHAATIAGLRRWLPKNPRLAPGNKERILIHNTATGETTWEGKPIAPDAPVPDL